MCGIAGLCGFKGDRQKNIERMCRRMLYRGPDGHGSFFSEDGAVAFGHQRLAIVDLTPGGAQPMTSASGRYTITYNGEVYNYKEVRDKLLAEQKVSAFKGSSDTEVLLDAIESYGVTEALKLFKGMFAFAVYDHENGTVTLARDRVGEKPLYYGFIDGAFVFASDIGCISVIDGFEKKINKSVLSFYFERGYIPAPYTIYEDIYKLLPGTILTMKAPYEKFDPLDPTQKASHIEHFWSMSETAYNGQRNKFKGSEEEAADELERLLKEAIKGQMVADVPVGAFLSAGIDSSTVVSLMQALDPGKVRTFTIGMEEKAYDESDAAAAIAKHLGTDHTQLMINEKDAKAVIPLIPHMFGEPFGDSSQIPTYLVSKMTRQHVTVSLSGDAGDELFCGYRSYDSVNRIWGKMQNVPYGIRKPAGALLDAVAPMSNTVLHDKAKLLQTLSPADLYRQQYELDPLTEKLSLTKEILKLREDNFPHNILLDEVNHEIMLRDMLLYHPDDILVKVDRTAMAVSLETRVPLLDKDVVEFAWTLPIEYLRDEKVGKKVLRDVLYRYVPKELLDRPKKGFSVPVSKWLKEDDELRAWAEELLDEKSIKNQGLLDADVVGQIWKDFIENGNWRPQIWYVLMLECWIKEKDEK